MEALFNLEGVDGQLAVYENKIVISRNGLASRSVHGNVGDKSIPIDSIKYITLREWTVWKRGEIGFGVDGSPNKINYFDSNKNRENCIIFTREGNEIAREIKDYIENRIYGVKDNPTVSGYHDATDEILKYKKLLDMGAITQDEFEQKKKQLLGL